MPTKTILNPLGAYEGATPLWTTDEKNYSNLHQRTIRVRANATVTKGDALQWVIPTATVPPSVEPVDVSDTTFHLFAGCALNGASADGSVDVVIEGFCLANFGSGTITAGGELFSPATTDGVFDVTGDNGIGWVVTPEFGSTGFAVVFLGSVGAIGAIDDLT